MSESINFAEFERRVADPLAHASRVEFCENTSNAIDSCGRVLWAYGAASDFSDREGIALVCQIAGELAIATVDMYKSERWYPGAALLRQFIECEYLLYMISVDPQYSGRWRSSTRDQRRKEFTPHVMREQSNGKFRTEEYSIHCERGGHPSPWGASLLAEHTASLLKKNQYLWVDLAHHLTRFWASLESAIDALGLKDVGLVQKSLGEYPAWRQKWIERDLLSTSFDLSTEME